MFPAESTKSPTAQPPSLIPRNCVNEEPGTSKNLNLPLVSVKACVTAPNVSKPAMTPLSLIAAVVVVEAKGALMSCENVKVLILKV